MEVWDRTWFDWGDSEVMVVKEKEVVRIEGERGWWEREMRERLALRYERIADLYRVQYFASWLVYIKGVSLRRLENWWEVNQVKERVRSTLETKKRTEESMKCTTFSLNTVGCSKFHTGIHIHSLFPKLVVQYVSLLFDSVPTSESLTHVQVAYNSHDGLAYGLGFDETIM